MLYPQLELDEFGLKPGQLPFELLVLELCGLSLGCARERFGFRRVCGFLRKGVVLHLDAGFQLNVGPHHHRPTSSRRQSFKDLSRVGAGAARLQYGGLNTGHPRTQSSAIILTVDRHEVI